MIKKAILACMALAAFAAFVLPATASATNDPTLTDGSPRVDVAVNSKIIGTNVGETTLLTTGGAPLIHCTTATMTGKVLVNSGGTVEGTIEKATFAGTGAIHPDTGDKECTASFGNAGITVSTPMCLRSTPAMATDEFRVEGDDCIKSGTGVTFNILSTTAGECKYETTGAVIGHFTTESTGDALLTVTETQSGSGAAKESGGFLCPSSGMLRMTFTLETDTLPDTTADPIWIS